MVTNRKSNHYPTITLSFAKHHRGEINLANKNLFRIIPQEERVLITENKHKSIKGKAIIIYCLIYK